MGLILGVVAAILLISSRSTHVMNPSRDWASKAVLLAIILLVPYIGAGLYLFALREKGYA